MNVVEKNEEFNSVWKLLICLFQNQPISFTLFKVIRVLNTFKKFLIKESYFHFDSFAQTPLGLKVAFEALKLLFPNSAQGTK